MTFFDVSIQSILEFLVELRSKPRSLFTELKELLYFKDEIPKWSDLVSGIICKGILETSLQRKIKKGTEHVGEEKKKNRWYLLKSIAGRMFSRIVLICFLQIQFL